MRLPEFATMTGLDERTDLVRLSDLCIRYPIETGTLFSPKKQGSEPRYPDKTALQNLLSWRLQQRQDNPLSRHAAHLCGGDARLVNNAEIYNILDIVGYGFTRYQINAINYNIDNISSISPDCIIQHRTLEFPQDTSVAYLYDKSGGRGDTAVSYPPHPGGNRLVGYAGGISPLNVLEILEKISSTGPYWIDMETHIRTDDWLDLDKVETVCRNIWGE
jgi:hypothetical protein